VFVVYGSTISRMIGWQEAATITATGRWKLDELLAEAETLVPGLHAVAPEFPVPIPGG
jgi:hypothetical protein